MNIRYVTTTAIAGGIVIGQLLTGCSGADGEPAETTATILEQADTVCRPELQTQLKKADMADEADARDFMQIGDGGKSLSVSNASQGGDASATLTLPAMACLLGETKAPDSVIGKFEQTTALMGRQEATWKSVTVSWSYHPDNGVSAVFEEK